ncbi:MAG: NAD(+)/NADH kinase, partial [Patescibacteria group bacterium]
GPILHPTIDAIILTPINAYAFNQKPLVLPASDVITISVLARGAGQSDFELSLTLDGQTNTRLKKGDEVTIQKHPEHVRFLRRRDRTFSMKLRDKLKWGE